MSDNPVLARVRVDKGFAQLLGDHLGITREAVWMWKKVPPKHAFRVAKYMNLSVAEVCPELVPDKPPRLRRRKRTGEAISTAS